MALLTINNVHFSHGSNKILNGITLSIEPGERIGVVGRNGTGKTTLLRIVSGDAEPDEGRVQIARGSRIGYLLQDPVFDPDETVFSVAETAFAELHATHDALNKIAEQMGDAAGDSLDQLLAQYATLERDMERLGGYTVEHKIHEALEGLGFPVDRFTQKVGGLSGGERSRLALVKLLLTEPDLLLLDEPTNHLDIEGRQWLERFLVDDFPGAVLIVSHDRYLLGSAVTRIIETELDGSLASYPGNYTQYRAQRKERKLTQARIYDKQQDHIRSEKQFIARYKAGQRAKQAAGRQSKLTRFKADMVNRPRELDVMKLRLPKPARSGDLVLKATDLSKWFDDRCLFENMNLTISRQDRYGIIGPNGAGKTTLVRCLLEELESTSGEVSIGANVSVGYFSQMHEGLRLELNVWEYLQSVILSIDGQVKASEQQARDLAGAFMFSGDDQDKTLRQLSGGERNRVVLAGLVSGQHNVLVLDEPTNHFDIPSSERLEQALNRVDGFQGTVIVISHDRAFLDACVDQLLVLDGQGSMTQFLGNYAEWASRVATHKKELATQKAEVEYQAKRDKAKFAQKNKPNQKQTHNAKNKSKKNKNETQAALSRMSIERLESRIEEIESKVRKIDAAFLDTDVQRDGKRLNTLASDRAALLEALEPLEFEWANRASG